MERNNLGVSKTSKNIRKSPLHQPNTSFNPQTQTSSSSQSQQQSSSSAPPQIYNISKNDFRTLVQQLTSHNPPIPSNSSNFPNPNYHHSRPPPPPVAPPNPNPNFSSYPPARPPPPKPPSQRLQKIRPPPLAPIPRAPPPPTNPNPHPNFNPNFNLGLNPNPSSNTNLNPRAPAESPVSAYMRYLESSIINSDGAVAGTGGGGVGGGPRTPVGLLPSPAMMSPSAFLNLASPRSPYSHLLSPRGSNYPPPPFSPLTPNFAFSPGLLGPGPGQLPPLSPTLMFPQSPSAFLLSPRWREM